MARLVMLVHEEGRRYGGSFPDLPGCTTVASDLDGLLVKAPAAVAFHLAGLAEEGVPVPHFRTLGELRTDPIFLSDAIDAIVILVDHHASGRTIRINVTVDEGTLRRIDEAAEAAGESRSGYLVSAAKTRMITA